MLLQLAILSSHLILVTSGNLLEVVEKCNNQLAVEFICDPANVLSPEATKKIEKSLKSIQLDTGCPCANTQECYRLTTDTSGYTAGLVVLPPTESSEISESDLATVYYKANLPASPSCDNGILIVYHTNKRELYTRRGLPSYNRITDEDELNMFNKSKSKLPDTETMLVTLLNDYRTQLKKTKEVRKWSNVSDLVGMIFGSLLAIVAIAGILAIFLTLCCHRNSSRRSDKVKILGGTNSLANSLSAASISSGKKPLTRGKSSPDSVPRGPQIAVPPQNLYDNPHMTFGSVKPGDSPRPLDSPSQAHLANLHSGGRLTPDGRPISRESGSFIGASTNPRGCETQTLKMKLTDA